ncbi:MAG TPA: YceI family protein [Kofleriaceae bacterium]|nr:YceI family protein [Kofleriaceae bacterium]
MASPIWAATPAVAALSAAVARWLVQGSGNVYTATTKRFYVPDPDLGWRVAPGGPFWIGLELVAVIGAVAAGVAIAALILRRLERRRGNVTWARAGLWIVAALTLAAPAWAFASGMGPARGREALPEGASAAAPTSGLEGSLELPAGRYDVVAHAGTAITARVEAGEERFEARFGRGITGAWTVDPRDLTKPGTGEFSVDVAAIDTGIALRTEHARDEYLHAARFPRLTLRIGTVVATRQDGPRQVAFRAAGTLAIMGEDVAVELTGNVRATDDAARARLGLPAGAAAVLVDADFTITVSGTPLRADRDSFDSDRLPIHVSLVLLRSNS